MNVSALIRQKAQFGFDHVVVLVVDVFLIVFLQESTLLLSSFEIFLHSLRLILEKAGFLFFVQLLFCQYFSPGMLGLMRTTFVG